MSEQTREIIYLSAAVIAVVVGALVIADVVTVDRVKDGVVAFGAAFGAFAGILAFKNVAP